MVLAFASILLGCSDNSSQKNVVEFRNAELEKQVFESTMEERRQTREAAEARIARTREELKAAQAADPKSDRVKILEAELSQWEQEAAQYREETYKLARERWSKQHKGGGK